MSLARTTLVERHAQVDGQPVRGKMGGQVGGAQVEAAQTAPQPFVELERLFDAVERVLESTPVALHGGQCLERRRFACAIAQRAHSHQGRLERHGRFRQASGRGSGDSGRVAREGLAAPISGLPADRQRRRKRFRGFVIAARPPQHGAEVRQGLRLPRAQRQVLEAGERLQVALFGGGQVPQRGVRVAQVVTGDGQAATATGAHRREQWQRFAVAGNRPLRLAEPVVEKTDRGEAARVRGSGFAGQALRFQMGVDRALVVAPLIVEETQVGVDRRRAPRQFLVLEPLESGLERLESLLVIAAREVEGAAVGPGHAFALGVAGRRPDEQRLVRPGDGLVVVAGAAFQRREQVQRLGLAPRVSRFPAQRARAQQVRPGVVLVTQVVEVGAESAQRLGLSDRVGRGAPQRQRRLPEAIARRSSSDEP